MNNDIKLASNLRAVTSHLFKRLRRETRIEEDLSMTELATLANLYHNRANYPSELAALEKVKTQSMSQVLNHLEELRLIERTPSETDKRKTAISLSAHGREMVAKTRLERDEWLANAIETHLTPKQKTIIEEAVAILQTLADIK